MATLALVVTLALCAARPPNAEFRKAFEANRDTLVEVRAHRRRAQGVLVGAQGQVLAALSVQRDQTVQVLIGPRSYDATVLLTDPSIPVCLLAITPPGSFHAAAVRTRPLKPGDWLVALSGQSQSVAPDAGQVSRIVSASPPWLETTFRRASGQPLVRHLVASGRAARPARRPCAAHRVGPAAQLSHPMPELP